MLTRWNNYGLGDFGFPDLGRGFFNLNELRREMDRVFEDFDRGYTGSEQRPRLTRSAIAWPRFSLDDTGGAYLLRAEVPGLGQDDLNITVEQNVVSIRGERKTKAPEGYSVHRQERGNLAFAKSFTLPGRVDAEKVTASLKNGVLELSLPRVAEEQPRQIQVKVS